MSTHWKPDGLTDPPPDFSSQFTVNKRLTPNRRGLVVENDEYDPFLLRVIRAYSRRVAAGDIDAISAMARIARETDTAIRDAISGLRSIGYSWADIVYTAAGINPDGTSHYEAIGGWKTISRSDTGAVLSINKDTYTIIDHAEMGEIVSKGRSRPGPANVTCRFSNSRAMRSRANSVASQLPRGHGFGMARHRPGVHDQDRAADRAAQPRPVIPPHLRQQPDPCHQGASPSAHRCFAVEGFARSGEGRASNPRTYPDQHHAGDLYQRRRRSQARCAIQAARSARPASGLTRCYRR
jgi:hypothetical protein